jgi:pimeloyl-ACP methyl ester carboxylesterase
MAQLADDVTQDLPALTGGEPFLLGGLSMGGYVVLELLRRHRRAKELSGLRGIVLMDTRASEDDAVTREKREAAREAIAKEGMASALHAMLPNLIGANARGGPSEAVAFHDSRDAARGGAGRSGRHGGGWLVGRLPVLDLLLLVLGRKTHHTAQGRRAIAESATAAPRLPATVPAPATAPRQPRVCADPLRAARDLPWPATARGG